MKNRKAAATNGTQFKPGSRVRLPTAGKSSLLLEVIEDRGNIGWQGSHILHVRRISEYPEERDDFEVFADRVILAD
jgi:hypothetical protein